MSGQIKVGDMVEVTYAGEVTGVTEKSIFVQSLAGVTTIQHYLGAMEVKVLKRSLPTEDGLYVEKGDSEARNLYRRVRGQWSLLTPFEHFPNTEVRAGEAHNRNGLVQLVPSDRESE